jgi:hypothetical protein
MSEVEGASSWQKQWVEKAVKLFVGEFCGDSLTIVTHAIAHMSEKLSASISKAELPLCIKKPRYNMLDETFLLVS